MSWNYRVMATQTPREVVFRIHEVYYNKNGIPRSYTKSGITILGYEPNDISLLLNKMLVATDKPTLWLGERFPEEYDEDML